MLWREVLTGALPSPWKHILPACVKKCQGLPGADGFFHLCHCQCLCTVAWQHVVICRLLLRLLLGLGQGTVNTPGWCEERRQRNWWRLQGKTISHLGQIGGLDTPTGRTSDGNELTPSVSAERRAAA